MEERDPLTEQVIGAAIEVHRLLGPGLLESVCQRALCHELMLRVLNFLPECAVPVVYKGVELGSHLFIHIRVEERLIVELKAVENLEPIHTAQILTYMRLSGKQIGLLLNFNVRLLKDGIRRVVLSQ